MSARIVRSPWRAALAGFIALLAIVALGGCAYYNTYYLAKKYYYRATLGDPYALEGANVGSAQNYNKAIDYSKKVIANYPKSKWVDDAYLMWARALIGRDDPRETVNMLRDFTAKYPQSPVAGEALFYLGLAHRSARQYAEAISAFGEFLEKAPKHDLVPYALYERGRAERALKRPLDAERDATVILERFPKSVLQDRARTLRAEARFDAGQYERAREDFRVMGERARTDDERFELLLREADALEAGRRYPESIALLNDALSHEQAPIHADTTGGRVYTAPTGPGADRYGRLMLRVGTVHLLSGRFSDALIAYRRVVEDYPRTALGAEAQYRIGYAYESEADDFARAREAYTRVREHGGSQAYLSQAAQRLAALEQIEKFRTASGDSLQRRAEMNLMLAEQYLFQLDKPERALEQYARLADSLKGTPWAAKALTAQAWVLSNKLSRKAEAESLLWIVVRQYPETEAQLAARDYLEMEGRMVPADLIRPPQRPAPTDSVLLSPPPALQPFGLPTTGRFAPRDSLGRPPLPEPTFPIRSGLADSTRLGPPGAGTPYMPIPPDTARTYQQPDTTRRRP